MRGPSWRRPVLAALGLVLTVVMSAACIATPVGGDETWRARAQAKAALARWAEAVAAAGGPSRVVLVGELTGQVGDWEEANGDNKAALMSGMVEQKVDLPADAPPDGEVRWEDGTTERVRVASAAEAVAAIRSSATMACPGCVHLEITAARLTTGPIATSRGPATGPIWQFTIDGTAVKVTRVAIDHPVTVTPPRWDADDPPVGVAIESASGSVDGRKLTVAFVGAPSPGDEPCGEDYTTEAVESDLAVVVIVYRHRNPSPGDCGAVGARRSADVTLAAPLGERAVLEVRQGLPVSVTLVP